MAESSYRLSVSIPTYNRPRAMERLLRSLLPQLTSEVEIVIRDDSPGGETEAVVRRLLAGKEAQLTYSHGEKLGIDRGTLWTVEHARGDYVWTFGDDDEMVSNGIARVIELVKQQPELSFIWTNILVGGVRSLPLDSDTRYENGSETIMALRNKMTLLSTFILKREHAMRGMPIALRHDRSMWSIMGLVYTAVAAGPTYAFAEPLIVNHLEPHGEADVLNGVQVFGINFARVLYEFKGKFSSEAIRTVVRTSFKYVWRGFLVNRGRYDVRLPWKMVKDLFAIYGTAPGFLAMVAASVLPHWFVRGLYAGYRVLKFRLIPAIAR